MVPSLFFFVSTTIVVNTQASSMTPDESVSLQVPLQNKKNGGGLVPPLYFYFIRLCSNIATRNKNI